MIRENNAMTFTNRLSYSVSEVSREEFLVALSKYGKTEEDKHLAEKIEDKFKKLGKNSTESGRDILTQY
jgi:hypothetical protein